MSGRITALDLFAGTGWGVACQRLGIKEYGVENMPEAVATRADNGMRTAFLDVWDGLEGTPDLVKELIGDYGLLIASPPCQTFSMAGKGAGRAALDEVLSLIASKAYLDVAKLREFGERHDPRTSLVLTPLAYVARDLPRLVIFEQVPTVLPVWEACAEEMRQWGYSVVTGILNAEEYGVPQTRKRAILIARWDKAARMPTPTHNRYNPRAADGGRYADPTRLPWVSMHDALGWGRSARPSVTVTGGGTSSDPSSTKHTGGAEPLAHLAREVAAPDWVMRSNYGTNGDPARRGKRTSEQPAPTITSKADRNMIEFVANDKLAHSAKRGEHEPAPTITGGHDYNNRVWQHGDVPATTVQGDPRIAPRGHHDRQMNGSTRVTIDEAAALQSYPEGFTFSGTKGKQFLQVGNAVPPRLAGAILDSLLD